MTEQIEQTDQTQQDQDEYVVGPIDYLAVEFPGARLTGEGLAALLDLVDRGIIRILDLRVAKLGTDGVMTAVELADLDGDGTLDLSVFAGVTSGLIDDDDVAVHDGAQNGIASTWLTPLAGAAYVRA